jgi:enolase-phosphatase E1
MRSSPDLPPIDRRGYRQLLLDIEGTTCPVSFVAETLFPYASAHLGTFLEQQSQDEAVQQLLSDVEQAWQQDADPQALQLRADRARPLAYLQLLIRQDRKLTALKDLQGLVWRAGYASGALKAPLYSDVPAALQRWYAAGVALAVYSSGSVPAQQLLYGHSTAGDLRPLFQHWFDTRIGPKQNAESYRCIAEQLPYPADAVLFISDALAECEAAAAAGMAVLFSDRDGNPQRDPGPFERISSFDQLLL